MTSSQVNVAETPPMSANDLEGLKDENGLYAGKFKSIEDLAASYKELEGKLGAIDQTREEPEGNVEEQTETEEVETETEEVDYQEIYGDGLAEVLNEVGIDPEDITNRFLESGNISDDDYAKLKEGGFSEQVINTYLDGIRSQGDVEEIAKGQIASIKDIAGGEQGYEQMKSWANENLTADDIDAFDNLTKTGSAPAIKLAVQGLYSQYNNAMGIEPDLVTGRQSTNGLAPFRSASEVTVAMNDPRYKTDVTYRQTVEERLRESDVFKRGG
tara:strand:- start:1453 stop:2265 length:813 start_codon:yes stop_codon:yes gene_type:complete